ncbi:MAG: type II toxin-antitoxin system Phd/YefM family antitoxin [Acidimicrobiales bacterium]
MRVASVSEARNTLSALLDLVRAGQTVLIVDRGTPVARLEAVSPSRDPGARLDRLERSGVVRRGTGGSPAALGGPPPGLVPGNGTAALDALAEERRTGR